jgi:hypothetical protein
MGIKNRCPVPPYFLFFYVIILAKSVHHGNWEWAMLGCNYADYKSRWNVEVVLLDGILFGFDNWSEINDIYIIIACVLSKVKVNVGPTNGATEGAQFSVSTYIHWTADSL